ncbi:MAG: nucleotidyltransferase family protein [Parasporobacterium sp.]|nr:nucleotidyltransferase family protein [Parasporobacterium sp.]
MKNVDSVFLSVFMQALKPQLNSQDPELTADGWKAVLSRADEHSILPLVCDKIFDFKSFRLLDSSVRKAYQENAVRQTIRQIEQEKDFLTFLLFAQENGYDPIVIKGLTIRHLYAHPFLRPSVDEDLLINSGQAVPFHQTILEYGFEADAPDADIPGADELGYHKPDSPSYIELHKHLFSTGSGILGDFNQFFENYSDRTVRVQIEDVSVRTLAPTDHLLYLILHAFKHFVHSGIGIRAVCDIGLFAEHHASDIDWEHVRSGLEEVHAFDFARGLFRIAQLHLLPDAAFYCCISDWKIEEIDTEPLLDDILSGGVHGNSSLERLHSSNITLNAIENDRKESSAGQGFLSTAIHSVFLPLGKMSVHYPYLKKAPFLLPAAWIQRIGKYLQERKAAGKGGKNTAAGSIRLGRSRVELLKKYGIIR